MLHLSWLEDRYLYCWCPSPHFRFEHQFHVSHFLLFWTMGLFQTFYLYNVSNLCLRDWFRSESLNCYLYLYSEYKDCWNLSSIYHSFLPIIDKGLIPTYISIVLKCSNHDKNVPKVILPSYISPSYFNHFQKLVSLSYQTHSYLKGYLNCNFNCFMVCF